MMRLLMAAIVAVLATPAFAHYLTIYTPKSYLAEPATVPVGLMFWHPLGDGPIIDMATPREFYMVHNGRSTDLLPMLKPVTFATASGSAAGFTAAVPMQGAGDYILTAVTEPYFDEIGGLYIQSIAKTYVNRGKLPSDWYIPVGLDTEIVPMMRPYNVFAGSTFTAIVLSGGEPVPGAEVEVAYLAAEPDLATATAGKPTVVAPEAGLVSVFTDPNGYFTFGVPKTGWWSFTAIGIGPDRTFNGKPMSQDASIWVHATEFGE